MPSALCIRDSMPFFVASIVARLNVRLVSLVCQALQRDWPTVTALAAAQLGGGGRPCGIASPALRVSRQPFMNSLS